MVRIAFFGTPAFAVPTLEALLASPHRVVGAVTQPDRPRGRGRRVMQSPVKQTAAASGLPVLQPARMKDPAFMEALAALAPDLGVVAAYGRLLPDALLALPRLGMINVHASLLPKYRGAAPIHHAVMAGETETGVTIIRLVREMDAGPMLRRAPVPIGADDTSETLDRQAGRARGRGAAAGRGRPRLRPRRGGAAGPHARATFAPRLTRDVTGGRRHRLEPPRGRPAQPGPRPPPVAPRGLPPRRRALPPPPHRAGRSAPGRSGRGARARPGQVIEAGAGRLVVAAGGDTALSILEIQPEGGRALPVRAFLAGRRIAPGAVFETAA